MRGSPPPHDTGQSPEVWHEKFGVTLRLVDKCVTGKKKTTKNKKKPKKSSLHAQHATMRLTKMF